MSNMHRIMWFDQQIKASKYPNRITLAEQFEISIRQAQRDIDYLKDSIGAPIEYDVKNKGYYYTDETFLLPNVYINEEQKRLLGFLAYSYESYNQTPKVKKITQLFKQLSQNGDTDGEIPVFDINKPAADIHYAVSNAVKNRNKIKLKYRHTSKGQISVIIHPYNFFHKYRSDYIYCFCEEFNEIINLRADRVIEFSVTDELFQVRPDFINGYRKNTMQFSPYVAKIKFLKEPCADNFREFNTQRLDGLTYHVEFYDIDGFINLLLTIEYWDIIYSPRWLKEKIKERCTRIIGRIDNSV